MSDHATFVYALEEPLTDQTSEALLETVCRRSDVHIASTGVTDVADALEELRASRSVVLECAGTQFSWLDTGSGGGPAFPRLRLRVHERYLSALDGEDDGDALERWAEFWSLVAGVYERFVELDQAPLYVYGLDLVETDLAHRDGHPNQVTREKLRAEELPCVFWGQIHPPVFVDALGRDRVESCPAYRRETLSDGAVLLVAKHGILGPFPEDYVAEASEHLGVPFET